MTTTVEAIYEQGVLRLKQPIALEDGAEVEVIVISHKAGAETQAASGDIANISALLEQCAVDTGITDLADQHDHYLYGTPKRDEQDIESTG